MVRSINQLKSILHNIVKPALHIFQTSIFICVVLSQSFKELVLIPPPWKLGFKIRDFTKITISGVCMIGVNT